jgi:hypothetical protein
MNDSSFYANIVFAAVIIIIGVYLWRMRYLIGYIERVHTTTWEELGRPSVQPPRSGNIFQFVYPLWSTAKFAVFSSQYRTLGDAHLTKVIWSIRALFIGGVLLMIVMSIVDPHGPWAALHR